MGGGGQPPLCSEGLSCQPVPPAGWLGPVAYWQGESGEEVPDCPEGYAEPMDLHADPDGAPADCSCTCKAEELECGGAQEVTIYGDLSCNNACATAGPQECTPAAVSGCSGAMLSMHVPEKDPTGSCAADVKTELTSPRWHRDARFCELATEVDDCGAEQACFPTPSGGFSSQLCVYRVVLAGQAAPECPDEYPNRDLLYSSFKDERDCGDCDCEGPSGGSCVGEVIIGTNSDCSSFTNKYVIGEDDCLQISKPSHIEVTYMMTPGSSCAPAGDPEPIGEVVPSGNYHAVCCQ